MKNREALRLYNALQAVQGVVGNARFTYAVVINKRQLETIAEALRQAQQVPEDCAKLVNGRYELLRAYAVTDANGQPVIAASGNVRLKDGPSYEAAWKKLKEQMPEEADRLTKWEADVARLLEEVADSVNLSTVPLRFIPELPVGIVEDMLPMIDPNDPPQMA